MPRASNVFTAVLTSALLVAWSIEDHAEAIPSAKGANSTVALAESVSVPAPNATRYTIYYGDAGKLAPPGSFIGPGGISVNLAKFRGRPFLLVLWGISFPRSLTSLKSLDDLAAGGAIRVVALNEDATFSPSLRISVNLFLKQQKFKALEDYRDPRAKMIAALDGPVSPSAILYDAQGREVLQIIGDADFTSAEVRGAIAAAK